MVFIIVNYNRKIIKFFIITNLLTKNVVNEYIFLIIFK